MKKNIEKHLEAVGQFISNHKRLIVIIMITFIISTTGLITVAQLSRPEHNPDTTPPVQVNGENDENDNVDIDEVSDDLDSETPNPDESEKPNTDESEKPSTGNTDKPSTGNSEKPSTGNTDKPSTGNSEKPSTGNTTDKPSTGNADKPATGNTDKPASKPVVSRGKTTCTVVPRTTVTEYTNLYFPTDPILASMGLSGSDGEKCTAVETTTLDGKVVSTKTITISEKPMTPKEVWVGTKEDTFDFWDIDHAYFDTMEAAKAYAENFRPDDASIARRIYNDQGRVSQTGKRFYNVRFTGHDGQPIYTAGWSNGHAAFTTKAGRLYRK